MGVKDTIPGMTAKHCIITDNCRVVQGGDEGAIDEALKRIRESMMQCIPNWPRDVGHKFHVLFTIDRHPKPTTNHG